MNCNLNKELLLSFSDNTIDDLDKIFVEEHLKYCTECKNELKLLDKIDSALFDIESDVKLPDSLSNLPELIVENSINNLKTKSNNLSNNSYFQNMKLIHNVIINSYRISKNDPCRKYIKKKLSKATKAIKKPIRKYIKKKSSKISIFKLLKIA